MAGVRMLLRPALGTEFSFITLFPAVFLAAWFGGLGPALLATVISVPLALFLFFPPTTSLAIPGSIGLIGAGLFILIGAATGWLGESRLRAQASGFRRRAPICRWFLCRATPMMM
jgi:K+-sensing histidine kinase KdpD